MIDGVMNVKEGSNIMTLKLIEAYLYYWFKKLSNKYPVKGVGYCPSSLGFVVKVSKLGTVGLNVIGSAGVDI